MPHKKTGWFDKESLLWKATKLKTLSFPRLKWSICVRGWHFDGSGGGKNWQNGGNGQHILLVHCVCCSVTAGTLHFGLGWNDNDYTTNSNKQMVEHLGQAAIESIDRSSILTQGA